MRKLFRRIHFLLNRQRLERELAEEMEAHSAMMPADRRSALRKHGQAARGFARGLVVVRGSTSCGKTWATEPGCWDARRDLLSGRVAVLALGVGVNLAEFQIFDSFLHRLNFRDADSVLQFARNSGRAAVLDFLTAQSSSIRPRTDPLPGCSRRTPRSRWSWKATRVYAPTSSRRIILQTWESCPRGAAFWMLTMRNPGQRRWPP